VAEQLTETQDDCKNSPSSLDYRFYQKACQIAGQTPSLSEFNTGRAKGLFRFTENESLLSGLVDLYGLSIHSIAGEWLVFSNRPGQTSTFGSTPLQAAVAWVINQSIDTLS